MEVRCTMSLSVLLDGYEQRSVMSVSVLGAFLVPGWFVFFVVGGLVAYLLCLVLVCYFEPAFAFKEHPLFDKPLSLRNVLLSWIAVFAYVIAAVSSTQYAGMMSIVMPLLWVLGGVATSGIIGLLNSR
jgi:hypothetical protein